MEKSTNKAEPAFFNISQAARYLNKDRKYVYRLIRSGALQPYVLPFAKWQVFRKEDLDKLAIPEWAAPYKTKSA